MAKSRNNAYTKGAGKLSRATNKAAQQGVKRGHNKSLSKGGKFSRPKLREA